VAAADIVHPRVAGIDVHKKVIWVAVRLPGSEPGERRVLVKSFRTFWRQLLQMAGWLAGLGVTDAAMESTGCTGGRCYHALAQAGQIEVCVANAAHTRNVPGRKTGLRDCQWIAELHEHGLLRPSFVPTAQVAALRQRARYRKKLIERRAAEGQRLALAAGERDPRRLVALAKGRLRAKLDALEMACDGRFTDAHGQLCRLHKARTVTKQPPPSSGFTTIVYVRIGFIFVTAPPALAILDLGTYWAQRPAFRRFRPYTAAHPAGGQDHEGYAFLQVTGPYLRVRRVGRLGLEPRTGGL
jgi:hypothetical protein